MDRMDRRSWLWRRKSSEKSPGETESSGSMSSLSERYSDDQEVSRASPNRSNQSPEVTSRASPNHNTPSPEVTSRASPNHNSLSPEVTSMAISEEVNENVKSLREKLSAAYLNISAKEDLVKQHSKVAEEAVSGWEKAETEVVILKQQLEAAAQKNSSFEDRLSHLDGALKECVRQLRQAREEQEQKVHEAVIKRTSEWESVKLDLENQLVELQSKLEASKVGVASIDSALRLKLETAEKENSSLKRELLARVEELEIRTLERDLSTQTAETASKQHLESIRKTAKLEGECRKLRAMARKASSSNDHKSVTALAYVESLTDSQSDNGDRLHTIEIDTHKVSSVELNGCDPSFSDSWASALIAELDQFKNDKVINRNLTSTSIEIDLMDDFLEMERLAALPETQSNSRSIESESTSHSSRDGQHKAELEAMVKRIAELEEKLEKAEAEKTGLEMTVAESRERLETMQAQLREAEHKLVELQGKLDVASDSTKAAEVDSEAANMKRAAVESQLIAMDAEVRILRAKVGSLETEVEKERALSIEVTAKYHKLEDELLRKRQEAELRQAASSNSDLKIKQEKELAVAAGKLAECQKTIASLGKQLKSLATLEDFMIDSEKPLDVRAESPISVGSGQWRLNLSDDSASKWKTNPSKTNLADCSDPSMNVIDGESPPSSSSTSTLTVNHVVTSEKGRHGFGKLFSRSKSAVRLENQ